MDLYNITQDGTPWIERRVLFPSSFFASGSELHIDVLSSTRFGLCTPEGRYCFLLIATGRYSVLTSAENMPSPSGLSIVEWLATGCV